MTKEKQRYHRNWYRCNKERRKSRNRKLQLDRGRDIFFKIQDYLRFHSCIDCGETELQVLEFDHRKGVNKKATISNLRTYSYNWKRIKTEIDKCDVRCTNCHRRKTAKDLNWYKNYK